MKETYFVNLVQICKAHEAGPDLLPVIQSHNNPAPIREDDFVAVLHISGSRSFNVVPLRKRTTIHDIKKKIRDKLGAELNYPSEQKLESFLKRN